MEIIEMLKFVAEHGGERPSDVLLRWRGRELPFALEDAVVQIESRQRTRLKLPGFNSCPEFLYPSVLASEQASDEAVAAFHASLVNVGEKVVDLTAGLGIDAFTIAGKAGTVTVAEMNPETNTALRHNAAALGLGNVTVLPPCDCREVLHELEADVVFMDPARRGDGGRRIFALADCAPDVTVLLPELLQRCQRLIVKASPMLDITQTIRELPGVSAIFAVARKGELKEILAVVGRNEHVSPTVEAVNILSDGTVRRYLGSAVQRAEITATSEPAQGQYIYMPDAAVMKLGPYALLTRHFEGLYKLDQNTNLYIAERELEDFPGRISHIAEVFTPNDKRLKELKGLKFNIITRNYPMSPEQLRRKLKTKDGGDRFLYAARCNGRPLLILCS